jgi:hypothetical protein
MNMCTSTHKKWNWKVASIYMIEEREQLKRERKREEIGRRVERVYARTLRKR